MCVCVCVRNAWVRTRSVWQVAAVMNKVGDNCVRAKIGGGGGVEECVGADEKCVAGGDCDEHGG